MLDEKRLAAIAGVLVALGGLGALIGLPRWLLIVLAACVVVAAVVALRYHWPVAVLLRWAGVGLLVGVWVVAFMLGYSRSPRGSAVPSLPSAKLPYATAQNDIKVDYPGGWISVDNGPEFPGIKLHSQIAVAKEPSDGSGVLTGLSRATGSAMLSRGFLARLSRLPPRDDRVVLGSVGAAYRYSNLRPRGVDRSLTVIVAPTTKGVLTVVCYADPADARRFARQCQQIWMTVRLRGATPYPLGSNPAYANALGRVLANLNRARARATARARGAARDRRPRVAASALEDAFARARMMLRRVHVSPADLEVHRRIVAALTRARDAYEHAVEASASTDRGLWRRARIRALGAESSLRRQVSRLARYGYALG